MLSSHTTILTLAKIGELLSKALKASQPEQCRQLLRETIREVDLEIVRLGTERPKNASKVSR